MPTPIEPKRNVWALPGLILWGLSPAILIATSVLGGWRPGDVGGIPGAMGEMLQLIGLLGMPFILYGWSVAVLLRTGAKKFKAVGLGFLLAILMCAVNLFLGISGCSMLTGVVPQDGIF